MSNQIYPSAVRSATFTGDDNREVPGSWGAEVALNVTSVPGTDTVQLVVEGRDPASGQYYPILSAAARAAVGMDVLTISPGVTAVANVSAADVLPDTYRARVVHSAGTPFTYSLSVTELG